MVLIDALFGSKTRVKLLHLFMNNPGKSFYVREITRLVDEQINSVRRELSNMLSIGIITSDNSDNKLFYQVNQRYEHFIPLREIFVDKSQIHVAKTVGVDKNLSEIIKSIPGVRIAIMSGLLVPGSVSKIDLLIVGDVTINKLKKAVSLLEQSQGRELSYSVLAYEDFYYRLSVRDKFLLDILNNKHLVLVDTENVLKGEV